VAILYRFIDFHTLKIQAIKQYIDFLAE